MATLYTTYQGKTIRGNPPLGSPEYYYQQELSKKMGALVSNSTKRDIPANLVPDFLKGNISLEELTQAIQGSPTFNPNIGPQINYGQGTQSLTPQEQQQLSIGVPLADIVSKRLPTPTPTAPNLTSIEAGIKTAQQTLAGIQQQAQPIIADKLGTPVAPIVVPPPVAKPDAAAATVAGATQTTNDIQKYIDSVNTAKTPEQITADTLTARINELLPQTAGKAQELATQESNLGIPAKVQQLADINSQIQTKTAEYNVLSADNQGKPITMNSIIGNERQILNAKGADIGLLQAQALGLQGQIDAGKAAAQQAVDLKYATIQDEITIKTQQLALIAPTLTAQEKTKADAITYALKKQQDDLDTKVAEEKDRYSTLLNLIQSYPDAGINLSTDTIESANAKITTNSKIYAEKIKPSGQDTSIIEINGKKLLINSQTGETIKDLGTTTGETKPLDVLDVARYNELYPEAGVVAGDTTATANNKVAASSTPEAQLKVQIQGFKDSGNSYEKVKSDIETSEVIADKETALKVAQDVYGLTTTNPGLGFTNSIFNFLFKE